MGEKYTVSRTSLGSSECREWAERNYMQIDKAQGNDACDKQNFQKVIASTRSKTHAYICCRFGKQNKEKYLKKEKWGIALL